MSGFHTLSISQVRKLSSKAVSLTFEIPENLKEAFRFTPGQYLTLETEINGKKVRRAYSICSAPNEEALSVGIKQLEGGVFSVFANQSLKTGSQLSVHTPEGRFLLAPDENKSYLAFASGSGITPVLSMLKAVLRQTKTSRFILVYGNRSPEDTMFLEDIKTLQNQYPDRLFVQWVYSRAQSGDSLFGRIDSSTVRLILNNKFKEVVFEGIYLCGPEQMIQTVQNSLLDCGIDKNQIHFELFTTSEDTKSTDVKPASKGTTRLTVWLDGESHELEIQQNHSVLESVLEAGIDAPFSCQGGVCSTCIARIKEGSAQMVKNTILTDGELAEGLTLTCQARPTSDRLVIDYDDV